MLRQEAQGGWKNGRDKASQHPWCQVWLWKHKNLRLAHFTLALAVLFHALQLWNSNRPGNAEAGGTGAAAKWHGQGLPGPQRRGLTGWASQAWKTFRYIIILNQTHIQYCKIISFFCDTVFWNQTPYDFIIEFNGWFIPLFQTYISWKMLWIHTKKHELAPTKNR
jgi:hypothetical protein